MRGQYQRIAGAWTRVEPKTETSTRTLALPSFAAAAALRAHRTRQIAERLAAGPLWQDCDLVFPTLTGAPQDGDSVSYQFTKRVARVRALARDQGQTELPTVTLHGLRHGAATILLARGLTLGGMQKVLGHSQTSLTADLYAHAAPEIFQNAADRMDAVFAAR